MRQNEEIVKFPLHFQRFCGILIPDWKWYSSNCVRVNKGVPLLVDRPILIHRDSYGNII